MIRWEYISITVTSAPEHVEDMDSYTVYIFERRELRRVDGSMGVVVETLNDYGSRGWELVFKQVMHSTNVTAFYLKRQLKE